MLLKGGQVLLNCLYGRLRVNRAKLPVQFVGQAQVSTCLVFRIAGHPPQIAAALLVFLQPYLEQMFAALFFLQRALQEPNLV